MINNMEISEVGLKAVEQEDNITRKKFEVEGTPIQVSWKEFTPTSEKVADPSKLVMFFPGWSMGESVKSAKDLNQTFADVSGERTLSVTSRPDSVIPNSLYKEAEAIAQYLG